MNDIPLSEIIRVLDLLGTVHRNKEKTAPNSALIKVKGLIAGGENLTLAEWLEKQQPRENKVKTKPKAENVEVDEIVSRLKSSGVSETAFDDFINELNGWKLSATAWRQISSGYTGKNAKTGAIAKTDIAEYFASAVRLAKRRELIRNSD